LGRDGSGARQIQLVQPAINDREQPARHNRFVISPEAFIRADKMARQHGWDVLGFYHSHPDAPARPSQYDLEHAWPVYSYVIVSVRAGRYEKMASWVLRDDRSGFDEQIVNIARPMERSSCQ
jgi:proteasome lid subunit RPN8/RPN11